MSVLFNTFEIVSNRIYQLVKGGESQVLDFKQSITDAGKIAKTIAAFANSSTGGTLIIGVKDNGRISGIQSEDEKYMFDLAAESYCKPAIITSIIEHRIDSKNVLECIVHPGENLPYSAKDEDGKWIVYLRVGDQTLKSGPIGVAVMKRRSSGASTMIQFREDEQTLLKYMDEFGEITLNQFCKLIAANRWYSSKILVNLISAGILKYNLSEKKEYFTLK